jgi:hypothetical protein
MARPLLVVAAAVCGSVCLCAASPSRAARHDTRAPQHGTAEFGVDVDVYTGPVPRDVWLRMKAAGQSFAIVQAWGGRSRNELASAQLRGARTIGGLWTAAYVLLNYDDKVCPTFSNPVRDTRGVCTGKPVAQKERGGRWQVRQGLAALGSELRHVAFVAIDVEWFVSSPPPDTRGAQRRRRERILAAIDEVRRARRQPVIYTRNGRRHWADITGCPNGTGQPECTELYAVIRDRSRPVPLWDVEIGEPDLDNFHPHAAWNVRAGRQYSIDQSLFGLSPERTVDLNVFDASLFPPREIRPASR